jgi:hypothetical protein
MESRIEKAVMKKKNGYNCAQAVACTYCDYAGCSEEEMFNANHLELEWEH